MTVVVLVIAAVAAGPGAQHDLGLGLGGARLEQLAAFAAQAAGEAQLRLVELPLLV